MQFDLTGQTLKFDLPVWNNLTASWTLKSNLTIINKKGKWHIER